MPFTEALKIGAQPNSAKGYLTIVLVFFGRVDDLSALLVSDLSLL